MWCIVVTKRDAGMFTDGAVFYLLQLQKHTINHISSPDASSLAETSSPRCCSSMLATLALECMLRITVLTRCRVNGNKIIRYHKMNEPQKICS